MAIGPGQTQSKRIIVLANSIKKHARCIAGRDVGNSKQLIVGPWIRPVSGESEGELESRHMRCDGGGVIRPLELIDVPLIRCANDLIHPEDWIVDAKRSWKRAGHIDENTLAAFEERPKHLWLGEPSHPDRVTGAFLRKQANHQSLYLVRPMGLRIELSFEHNAFKNRDQKRTVVKFQYNRREYRMNLTDPEFTALYCTTFPALGAPALVIRPPYHDKCLLCVSLTPEFNGYHYKVVATILELP